jgi:hypothetical protein
MSRHSWLFAAVAATVGLLVAACGAAGGAKPGNSVGTGGANPGSSASAKPNAGALSSEAVATIRKARSVHVSGTGTQGSQQVAVDVILTTSGGLAGKLTIGSHSVKLLITPRHTYIDMTRSIFTWQKIPLSACAVMCGKWLAAPHSTLKSLAGDVGWKTLVAAWAGLLAHNLVAYGGRATISGQPAVKLSVVGGAAYVAAHGPPYLLRIQAGPSQFTFSDWNTAALPSPLPASKVVTQSQLTGG